MEIDAFTGEIVDSAAAEVSKAETGGRKFYRIHCLDIEMDEYRIPKMVPAGHYLFKTPTFSSLDVVDCFCRNVLKMQRKNEEYMYMFCLATDGKAIGICELAHGSKSSSVVDPKSFAIRVILSGASNIILAHNHPSGNTNPSQSDDNTCERIVKLADLIGVKLNDFIIIGDKTYSYNANGKLKV